jgi:hypothetical protein
LGREAELSSASTTEVNEIMLKLCFCSTLRLQAVVLNEFVKQSLKKSGLETRDYGLRGSAALTMQHNSIPKSWH